MNKDLAQEAIKEALLGNWKEAVVCNQEILNQDSNDIDALNRIARAYAELGKLGKARENAQKVLKIDPFNTIATKSLEKWKGLKRGETFTLTPSKPQTFLEEPGKTKITSLIHLGSSLVLAKLDAGDEVKIHSHSHRICITTFNGKYIGKLPDNISARLRKLIYYGNEYQAFIKSTNKNDVKIFIKETKRTQKLKDIPSFSTEKIEYISFTPPELVHKKDEDFDTEEETEEEI